MCARVLRIEAARVGTMAGRQLWVGVLCSSLLAACTATPIAAPVATTTMTPASEDSATQAVATDSAPPPTPEPAPLVVDLGKIELAALRAALSKKLQVSEKVIVTVVVEPVEWGDASLGCPEPGMMYAQVITPGHRVVLAADGTQYNYHTALDGNFVLCEQPGTGSSAMLIDLLKTDLAARSGAAVADIVMVSSEAVQWSDAALGCPQPGKVYAKVITPGLRVKLELDGKSYEYHTGAPDEFVRCDSN